MRADDSERRLLPAAPRQRTGVVTCDSTRELHPRLQAEPSKEWDTCALTVATDANRSAAIAGFDSPFATRNPNAHRAIARVRLGFRVHRQQSFETPAGGPVGALHRPVHPQIGRDPQPRRASRTDRLQNSSAASTFAHSTSSESNTSPCAGVPTTDDPRPRIARRTTQRAFAPARHPKQLGLGEAVVATSAVSLPIRNRPMMHPEKSDEDPPRASYSGRELGSPTI
jgi:hypothetical protein